MNPATDSSAGSILIVDDNVENLHLLSLLLKDKDYQIRASKTGKEALSSVRASFPDLILLDVKLPDISGYEVCEKLKAEEATKDIPVIFISALNATQDKVNAFTVGGVDYITKPFISEEVLSRVKTHLEMGRLRSQLADQANDLKIRNLQLQTNADSSRITVEKLNASLIELDQGKLAALNLLEDLKEEIEQRKMAEEEIRQLNESLERRVVDRTAQLEIVNKELESFSHSVSHDLRAPLRHISGFADMLMKDTDTQISENARHYLDIIITSTKKMGNLIDDLLSFSKAGRAEMNKTRFGMNKLIDETLSQIKFSVADRNIIWKIANLPVVIADYNLLRLCWINLMENAVKYTRHREKALIEINCTEQEEEYIFSIQDNGVGFDMKYAGKLFGVFQRMHTINEFEGTGIGLANLHRIISRHGGRTWANAKVDKGATLYFTLPKERE